MTPLGPAWLVGIVIAWPILHKVHHDSKTVNKNKLAEVHEGKNFKSFQEKITKKCAWIKY